MPDPTERRYTVELSAREARATEIALRDWLGGDDVQEALGNGDHAMCETLRGIVAVLAGIRAEDDVRERRKERFREIMRINPRMPSREARQRAAAETI